MTFAPAEQIVRAVLYEGYNLYPYRPSSVKNRQRWTFGVLYPKSYCHRRDNGDTWKMQTECLVTGHARTLLEVNVRFLHLLDQTLDDGTVKILHVGNQIYHAWQEAVERNVTVASPLEDLIAGGKRQTFSFPAASNRESIIDDRGNTVAMLMRQQHCVQGSVELSAEFVGDDVVRVRVRIENETEPIDGDMETRDQVVLHSLVSTHTLLAVEDGEFASLLDPPENLHEAAEACQNEGTWPVLVGTPGTCRMMLSSPIILYDYPRVAPESAGDMFDGTEIDELLSLRVRTLTDEEQRQMAAVDQHARRILDQTRSETGEDQWLRHGTFCRANDADRGRIAIQDDGSELRPGSRVRLRPHGRADAFDILLRGMTATIVSIEQDYEDRLLVTVTVDDDPGRDLGRQGQIAHRFFFRPDELEPIGD